MYGCKFSENLTLGGNFRKIPEIIPPENNTFTLGTTAHFNENMQKYNEY